MLSLYTSGYKTLIFETPPAKFYNYVTDRTSQEAHVMSDQPEEAPPPQLTYYVDVQVRHNSTYIVFYQEGCPHIGAGMEELAGEMLRFSQAYTAVPFYVDANYRMGEFIFELKPEYAQLLTRSIALRHLLIEDAMEIIAFTHKARPFFLPAVRAQLWPDTF
jgi:hypothetical protein